jgi:hypothetical protein
MTLASHARKRSSILRIPTMPLSAFLTIMVFFALMILAGLLGDGSITLLGALAGWGIIVGLILMRYWLNRDCRDENGNW